MQVNTDEQQLKLLVKEPPMSLTESCVGYYDNTTDMSQVKLYNKCMQFSRLCVWWSNPKHCCITLWIAIIHLFLLALPLFRWYSNTQMNIITLTIRSVWCLVIIVRLLLAFYIVCHKDPIKLTCMSFDKLHGPLYWLQCCAICFGAFFPYLIFGASFPIGWEFIQTKRLFAFRDLPFITKYIDFMMRQQIGETRRKLLQCILNLKLAVFYSQTSDMHIKTFGKNFNLRLFLLSLTQTILGEMIETSKNGEQKTETVIKLEEFGFDCDKNGNNKCPWKAIGIRSERLKFYLKPEKVNLKWKNIHNWKCYFWMDVGFVAVIYCLNLIMILADNLGMQHAKLAMSTNVNEAQTVGWILFCTHLAMIPTILLIARMTFEEFENDRIVSKYIDSNLLSFMIPFNDYHSLAYELKPWKGKEWIIKHFYSENVKKEIKYLIETQIILDNNDILKQICDFYNYGNIPNHIFDLIIGFTAEPLTAETMVDFVLKDCDICSKTKNNNKQLRKTKLKMKKTRV